MPLGRLPQQHHPLRKRGRSGLGSPKRCGGDRRRAGHDSRIPRSEEHTSELQSHHDLVCRLLLEKKKAALVFGRIHPQEGEGEEENVTRGSARIGETWRYLASTFRILREDGSFRCVSFSCCTYGF